MKKTSQQMKPCFVTPRIIRIAEKYGYQIIYEPKYKYVGCIIAPDGRRKFFNNTRFDINPLGAVYVIKDKNYADFFLEKFGYPTIPGEAFATRTWQKRARLKKCGVPEAVKFAAHLGYPVMVKPNGSSQGRGVAKVHNEKELLAAIQTFEGRDRMFLIQKVVHGYDNRIVVLDDEVYASYTRCALTVVGDGKHTITELLQMKQEEFVQNGRDACIDIRDPRITTCLRHQGLHRKSVPPHKLWVGVLDNRNLSSGGEATDMTQIMHPSWKELAVQITRDMGLRFCGLDLMTYDSIDHPVEENPYVIIELNGAPGTDHFVSHGEKEEAAIDALYEKIFRKMFDIPEDEP